MDKLEPCLTLFEKQPQKTGILSRDYVEYRPVNQIADDSPLEFNIPAASINYVDLKRTRLHIKLQILKKDGTPVAEDDPVALVNLPLSSAFSQISFNLQHHPIGQLGTNYPYKAYFDVLLNTDRNDQSSKLSSMGYTHDDARSMDDSNPATSSNSALYMRSLFTRDGKTVDFEGPLFLDLFQQDRLLINGVPITIKLWPHSNKFKLMSEKEDFKLHIKDAFLKLCTVKPNPGVLVGHGEAIKKTPALYPYMKSVIKTFSLSSGHFAFNADDLFQGDVPNRLVIGCVSSRAFNGAYNKSPFRFYHYHCNYVNFMVDGQSVPSRPLQPDYENNTYLEAYQTLFPDGDDVSLNISRTEYPDGYCVYVINTQEDPDTSTLKKGHTRLEMKFAHALPESVTLVLYATFPSLLQIDQARNVYV